MIHKLMRLKEMFFCSSQGGANLIKNTWLYRITMYFYIQWRVTYTPLNIVDSPYLLVTRAF